MPTALDPRIAADLGPTWTGQAAALTGKMVAMDETVLASGLAFNEPVAGSGHFRIATPTDTSWVGTVYYDGTGLTPPIAWLPSDPIEPVSNVDTEGIAAAVWAVLISTLTASGTIGQFILNKLGLISAETVIVPGITLPPAKEFCLLRGDVSILSFNCVNTTGTAYDLSGANLLMLVKNDEGDADNLAVITKPSGDITITDAVAGQCTVTLVGADTTGLQTGTYWWGIKDLVQDKTVTRGTIVLQVEPVKAISGSSEYQVYRPYPAQHT